MKFKKGIIKSVGVHDAFSALVAERAGFETIFVGGFGSAASLLGEPDLNLLSLTEMADAVKRIAERVHVPVIADGDTGHGGVHNVARTVSEFERAGAQGLILEDQVAPKRCGHFQGKDVIDAQEMLLKIRAALWARKNKSFTIIARTDARDVLGLSEAVRRANLYLQAGADVAFVESPHSEDELEQIARGVKGPMLVNMLTGGKTPSVPLSRLQRMGFKIAVYPIESLMLSGRAMEKGFGTILKKGSTKTAQKAMVGFGELKEILGLAKHIS